MKILITTVLLGVLGVGSFHFARANASEPVPTAPQTCDATLTCTPQGTCVVECKDATGTTCSIEIDCDGQNCHVLGCDGPLDCPQVCSPGCK